MVGLWPTRCLQAQRDRTELAPECSILVQAPNLAAAEGLDVRKKTPLSKEEKCFFLTSPFIEPAVLVNSMKSKAWATRQRRRREGAGCQKKTLPGNKGEVFFLDIPFYRTRGIGEFDEVKKPGPPARCRRDAGATFVPRRLFGGAQAGLERAYFFAQAFRQMIAEAGEVVFD